MKTALSRGFSFGLAVALLLVFARPAAAHRLETRDVEPDYIVYGFALILYPVGDLLNHLFFGPHEKDTPKKELRELEELSVNSIESPEKRERKQPKRNFSPRKKNSPENSGHSEQMEMKEEGS